MKPMRDTADELAAKLPMLEAEVLGLRQRLARVTANQDELKREMDGLRRDRDHWQNLAKSDAARSAPRAWFCGRATGGEPGRPHADM